MSSCTAEKTLKASAIFKKRYCLFNRTFFCVDNEGVWIRNENRLAAAAANDGGGRSQPKRHGVFPRSATSVPNLQWPKHAEAALGK